MKKNKKLGFKNRLASAGLAGFLVLVVLGQSMQGAVVALAISTAQAEDNVNDNSGVTVTLSGDGSANFAQDLADIISAMDTGSSNSSGSGFWNQYGSQTSSAAQTNDQLYYQNILKLLSQSPNFGKDAILNDNGQYSQYGSFYGDENNNKNQNDNYLPEIPAENYAPQFYGSGGDQQQQNQQDQQKKQEEDEMKKMIQGLLAQIISGLLGKGMESKGGGAGGGDQATGAK